MPNPAPIPERFGTLVRGARESKGWSLTRLAETLGMNINRLRQIEFGRADPKWTEVVQLCLAMGLGLDRILYDNPTRDITYVWKRDGIVSLYEDDEDFPF